MYAEMPEGKNHVTTEAARRPSILKALLERASRDDYHSRKKYEEQLNLKKEDSLEGINIRREIKEILNNATWRRTLKESITQNLIKPNDSNKIKETNNSEAKATTKINTKKETEIIKLEDNLKIKVKLNNDNKPKIKEINDRKIKQNNNNTYPEKWKNIITLIHNSALQNVNLNGEGDCILERRKMNGSEISSGETVSIHSGTDSQYERLSPDTIDENLKENNIINQNLTIDTSNDIFTYNNSPENLAEISQHLKLNNKNKNNYLGEDPEERRRYQEEQSEEKRWKYIKIRKDTLPEVREEEDFDSLTLIEEDDLDDNKLINKNYKQKEKINNTSKEKNKIKLNKKLLPYYNKIKSKLKSYRIYFLTRHIKLLKKIIKNKNIRLASLTRTKEIQGWRDFNQNYGTQWKQPQRTNPRGEPITEHRDKRQYHM